MQEKTRALLEMVIPSSVLFKPGTTDCCLVQERARAVADAIYKIEDFVRVEITGHTDSRPADLWDSGFKDHWALSASRLAQSLKR